MFEKFIFPILASLIGAFIAVWVNDYFRRRTLWEPYADHVWKARFQLYQNSTVAIGNLIDSLPSSLLDRDQFETNFEMYGQFCKCFAESRLIADLGVGEAEADALKCLRGVLACKTEEEFSSAKSDLIGKLVYLIDAMRRELHVAQLSSTAKTAMQISFEKHSNPVTLGRKANKG